MRLIHDARPRQEPNPGGVTLVARELMDHLIAASPDWQHIVWTSSWTRPSIELPPHAEQRHLRFPSKATAILHGFRFDLPSLVTQEADLLVMYNLGFIGQPKLPYVQVVHDLSYLIEPHWYNLKTRWWHAWIRPRTQLQAAKHLFAVSETTKQDLMRFAAIPADRITVIPIAPSVQPTTTMAQLPIELEGKTYALILGGGNARKNVSCVLAAWAAWEKEDDSTWLVIIGDEKIPTTLKRVIQYPWCADEKRQVILNSAKLLLYPSWYEGFGLPLHEATLAHIPTLASCDGCIPETKPTVTELLPPSKPHLWLNGIRRHLKHDITTQFQPIESQNRWQTAATTLKEKILSL